MRQLICSLLFAIPTFLFAQDIFEDDYQLAEKMEESLMDVMLLFEQSQNRHSGEIKELNEQLQAKDRLIADLRSQLKQQIDLNYELKAQILTSSNLQTVQRASASGPAVNANLESRAIVVPEDEQIDINNASLEDLLTIPTMNELVAQRIVDNRPYDQLQDLFELTGVGQRRFTTWQPYLTVSPMTAETQLQMELAQKDPE